MICLLVGTPADASIDRVRARVPRMELVAADAAPDAVLAEAEAMFVWDFRWRSLEELMPLIPRLRWIHTASAGVDHVLLPSVLQRGIVVSNSAGVFERPMAEYVLALVLAHAKGIIETANARVEHRWAYRETHRISGTTMVVVGVGRIGREVGALAHSVGMRVIGVRRQAGQEPPGFDRVVGVDDLETVAARADYLVVTAALTAATRGLVGRSVVKALPRSAYVINVARSAVVDVAAIVDGLGDGRIAGAAIDVFDEEPLPADDPLWSVPNLFISPHMSADATGWQDRVVEVFAENAERFLADRPLATLVDVARGY